MIGDEAKLLFILESVKLLGNPSGDDLSLNFKMYSTNEHKRLISLIGELSDFKLTEVVNRLNLPLNQIEGFCKILNEICDHNTEINHGSENSEASKNAINRLGWECYKLHSGTKIERIPFEQPVKWNVSNPKMLFLQLKRDIIGFLDFIASAMGLTKTIKPFSFAEIVASLRNIPDAESSFAEKLGQLASQPSQPGYDEQSTSVQRSHSKHHEKSTTSEQFSTINPRTHQERAKSSRSDEDLSRS